MHRNTTPTTLFLTGTLLASATFALPVRAADEHGTDMVLGSSADGGGDLVVEYPFDEVSVVPVTPSGFPGLFTATDPGFLPAVDEPLEGFYELDIPTTVGLEIASIDDNVQVQLGLATLSAAGDAAVIGTHDNADPELSSLHTHPQFLLSLVAESPGEFAEGRFSFRFYDDGGAYGDSDVHTLELSNGYLPALETATSADRACRNAVAKIGRKLASTVHKRVTACFDAALLQVGLGTPAEALQACDVNAATKGSLAARLAADHEKSLAKASKSCGALTDVSEPFTTAAVSAHLGMTSCRSQELAGAGYAQAREALEQVLEASGGDGTCVAAACSGGVLAGTGGCGSDGDCSAEHAIDSVLPCLKTAAEHSHE